MPVVYKPLPLKKSQVDWGNPLSNGLVMDWKNNARSAQAPLDLVTGRRFSLIGTPTETLRRFGSGIDFGTNSLYTLTDSPMLSPFSYHTVEMIYIRDGGGENGYGSLFHHRDVSTSTDWFGIQNDGGDGGWGIRINTFYTATERVWSTPYPANGVIHHDICTYDHTNKNNTPLYWRDGAPITLTSRYDAGWTKTINANDMWIGGESTPVSIWDGPIFLIRYWKRILTKREVYQLYENPSRIYVPDKMILGKAGSVAPPSTAVQDMIGMDFMPFAR